MPVTFVRGLTLGAAVSVSLFAGPVIAQTLPCDQQLAGLDRRIESVRGNLTPPATRAELDTLDTYRRALSRVAQGGGAPQACAAVLNDAIAAVQSVENPRVLPADEFTSRKLRNLQGEEMGELGELVVDPVSGRVMYAVVELGGFLGLGERYFPVPWALVGPAPEGGAFILNVAKERLTAAPQFTRDNRPNMADRQWALALHTYYGVTPPWVDRGAALAAVLPPGRDNQPADLQEVERLKAEVERLNQELSLMRASGGSGVTPVPGTAGSAGGAGQPQPAPAPGKP